MPGIEIERVTKIFDGEVTAVDDVSLSIAEGEFVVLVGPSGCGKSTLLRIVAGLERLTRGRVYIGDEDVTTLEPPDRDIAMVFRATPSTRTNRSARTSPSACADARSTRRRSTQRVDAMALMLGLESLLDRKPSALSGGQRQRVAMGRALVREPRAFLMDEPLSNLDAKLRTSMRGELARLHERLPTTTLYVTHDQVEAMTLGQRVAVIRDGVVQQCDEPQVLFDRPANVFVGAFIGSPAMNLVQARLERGRATFADATVEIDGLGGHPPGDIALGIRPTSFELADARTDPAWPRMRAAVDVVEQLGAESNLLFKVDAPPVVTEAVKAAIGGESGADEGRLLVDDDRARFSARIHSTVTTGRGEVVELAIDPEQLYAFELETGMALEREPTAKSTA